MNGKEIRLGKWIQRLRQLHKNTVCLSLPNVLSKQVNLAGLLNVVFLQYETPGARKGFGKMTDEQLQQLEAIEFPFELPDEMKHEAVDWSVHVAFCSL